MKINRRGGRAAHLTSAKLTWYTVFEFNSSEKRMPFNLTFSAVNVVTVANESPP